MGIRFLMTALVVTPVVCIAVACGDDSSGLDTTVDSGTSTDTGGSGGSKPFTPRPQTDSGTPSTVFGDVEQDGQCMSQSDCVEGLKCVGTEFQGLNICAQPCATHADCGAEQCVTRTGSQDDLHCMNTVTEEFGLCGLAVTALCGRGRTCLLASDFIGVCVDLCALESDGDAGVDLSSDDSLVECKPEQTCLDILFEGQGRGVCMVQGARGDECGYDIGVDCDPAVDICAPTDPNDTNSALVCAQDCSDSSVTCDTGTCTDFQGAFAYCI